MKKVIVPSLIFIALLSSSFSLENGTTEVQWQNIEEVQILAKENPRSVFIDFTAKWCGWCKVMDKKTFTDSDVIDYLNSNFYAVKLNFDSPQTFEYLGQSYTAKELAKKNGITGLPTMLIASSDFKRVEKIIGYQKPKQFINRLKKFEE